MVICAHFNLEELLYKDHERSFLEIFKIFCEIKYFHSIGSHLAAWFVNQEFEIVKHSIFFGNAKMTFLTWFYVEI